MKNNIDWGEIESGEHDLCSKLHGKYVDVTAHIRGTWSVLFNNIRLKDDFVSRDTAQSWAESTDLINEISNILNK